MNVHGESPQRVTLPLYTGTVQHGEVRIQVDARSQSDAWGDLPSFGHFVDGRSYGRACECERELEREIARPESPFP